MNTPAGRATVGLRLSKQRSGSGPGRASAGSVWPAASPFRPEHKHAFPGDQIAVVKRHDRYRFGKRSLQRLAQPQPR